MIPEYVTGEINSCILELLLKQSSFDFCTVSKILICFGLIKHLTNDHKRYSSHSQVLVLHQATPIKVYLTVYESIKNSYLKTFLYHK